MEDDSDLEDIALLLSWWTLLMIYQTNKVTHPTVASIANECQSEVMMQLFLNKPLNSDAVFVVEKYQLIIVY